LHPLASHRPHSRLKRALIQTHTSVLIWGKHCP
jgi:hypothetical protein